jgi:hypothetical protein
MPFLWRVRLVELVIERLSGKLFQVPSDDVMCSL